MPPPDYEDGGQPPLFEGRPLPNRRTQAWRERYGDSPRPLLFGAGAAPTVAGAAPRITLRTRLLDLCELSSLTRPDRPEELLLPNELDCPDCEPQLRRTYGYWGIRAAADADLWMALEQRVLSDALDAITPANMRSVARAGWESTAEALLFALRTRRSLRNAGAGQQ
jgi:hypothetical protein